MVYDAGFAKQPSRRGTMRAAERMCSTRRTSRWRGWIVLDGDELSTLAGPPTGLFGATDATLTGLLGVQSLMLNDGTR